MRRNDTGCKQIRVYFDNSSQEGRGLQGRDRMRAQNGTSWYGGQKRTTSQQFLFRVPQNKPVPTTDRELLSKVDLGREKLKRKHEF